MTQLVAERVVSRYAPCVLKRTYEHQACSIAGTLELIGERWSLLILRDVFLGIHRFDDLQRGLGVARNVLRDRLRLLVDEDVLERRRYQERPERFEDRLTDTGLDLWPAIVALMRFGDRHLAGDDGPPMVLEHRDCGGAVTDFAACAACGAPLTARDVRVHGPGVAEAQGGLAATGAAAR